MEYIREYMINNCLLNGYMKIVHDKIFIIKFHDETDKPYILDIIDRENPITFEDDRIYMLIMSGCNVRYSMYENINNDINKLCDEYIQSNSL